MTKRAHAEQETASSHAHHESGETVVLSPEEEEQVRDRTAIRPAVVFETVRREGESELNRPILALAFSALAAGLSMSFSLIVTGVLQSKLPDNALRPLFTNFGYTIGFLIVILGRQQLFTENTVTAILPLLDSGNRLQKLGQVARLWGVVLSANIVGAAIMAYVLAHANIFSPDVKSAFANIGHEAFSPGPAIILLRGILAGWMIALMVWLLPAADTQKMWVILLITYIVGMLGLSHVIAGSIEVLYLVSTNALTWGQFFFSFFIPVLVGNCIGGVLLVSLLNYGQVAAES